MKMRELDESLALFF